MSFSKRYGPWALITGASAGIGAEFARQIAARGVNVALVARRQALLDELAGALGQRHGVETLAIAADLTAPDFIDGITGALGQRHVGLLVNNAGLGSLGQFLDQPLDNELRMLELNCRAPLILTHHFGRAMRDAGGGGIIMLASIAGLIPNPYMAHYGATKAWNRFVGEALAVELDTAGVDVTSVCPGPTESEFFERVKADPSRWPSMARMGIGDAQSVVADSLNGLGRRARVVPGWSNKLVAATQRFLPAAWPPRLVGRAMRMIGAGHESTDRS